MLRIFGVLPHGSGCWQGLGTGSFDVLRCAEANVLRKWPMLMLTKRCILEICRNMMVYDGNYSELRMTRNNKTKASLGKNNKKRKGG